MKSFYLLILTVLSMFMSLYGRAEVTASMATSMVDETAIDPTVDPCVDFYQYSCGNWLKRTEIPSDRPSWTRSFSTIDETALNTLHQILENYGKGKYEPKVKYSKKLGDFYASCMDESKIKKAGVKEQQDEFKQIDSVKDAKGLAALVADLHMKRVHALFSFGDTQDYDDATQMIAEIARGGIGLPEKEYYYSDDPKMKKIQENYVAHIGNMLSLAGLSKDDAKTIYEFEKSLIAQGLTPAERRLSKNYINIKDRAFVSANAPAFDWEIYYSRLHANVGRINIFETPSFLQFNKMLGTTGFETLRKYLKWRFISAYAAELGPDFENEDFHFKSENFTGIKALPPRWKRCTKLASEKLSEALGEAYVAAKFSPKARDMAQKVTAGNLGAMRETIKTLPWMDEATKKAALDKADHFMMKIGYPDQWRNYDTVKISRGSFLKNVIEATVFEDARHIAFIGKPTDRTLWDMPPQMVNAYYNAQLNEIVFPAAITQTPFFSVEASDGANYGAYGLVNGHEISHGFDDQGAEYDSVGNHKNWWTPQSKEAFDKKTKCLTDQYSGYTAIEDIKVNGALTLGENIADQAGSILAFKAYRASQKAKDMTAEAKLKEDREFFLSFGQVWCTKMADPMARTRAKTDPHSPPRWRVNGTLSNNPAFSDVFSCKAGTPMNPVNRCVIW